MLGGDIPEVELGIQLYLKGIFQKRLLGSFYWIFFEAPLNYYFSKDIYLLKVTNRNTMKQGRKYDQI